MRGSEIRCSSGRSTVGIAVAFGLLAACGKRPERIAPGSSPGAASRGADARSNTADAAPSASPHGAMDPHGMPSSPHGAASDAASPFAWTSPPGWTELPTTSMRLANFRPGGDPHAECYLTLLGGDAGGLGANINRWRAQLALPALDPAGIEALPKAPLLGRDAVLLEASGTWTGMNGMESNPGWGLTGLLLVEPGGSAFLKMTGPAKLVADEREHFLELAKSIRAARATDAKPASSPNSNGGKAPISGGATEPPGGAPSKSTAPTIEIPQTSPKDEFAWTLPEGWRRAPDKEDLYPGAGNRGGRDSWNPPVYVAAVTVPMTPRRVRSGSTRRTCALP